MVATVFLKFAAVARSESNEYAKSSKNSFTLLILTPIFITASRMIDRLMRQVVFYLVPAVRMAHSLLTVSSF